MKPRSMAVCGARASGGAHEATFVLPDLTHVAPVAWRPDLQDVPQWDDWRWQMRNRLRTPEQLCESFPGVQAPPGLPAAAARFPFAITPYYASLIRPGDPADPILQMSLPHARELWDPPFLRDDPLEEDADMPVPGLVHRYADRALLVATSACAMYCRHCTRKRTTGAREGIISEEHLRQAVAYLVRHPEIVDVIISGGDPLTLPTAALERIVQAVRQVPSVEIIRIGTRAPVTLPMRVTEELVRMLRRYHPLWINTHFNHPRELTPESAAACARMADAGIPLGNQTVLMRGVNDHPRVIEQLCRGLVRLRVRPYYLFQCDLVRGVEHFRTPLSRGIEIMEYLRGRVSGLAIPTFCVDVPHGGGKIPLLPNYVVSVSPTHTVLRNFEGLMVGYPEPGAHLEAVGPESAPEGVGVWDLARGRASAITPTGTARLEPARTRRWAMRIGLTYDLCSDWLALGHTAEEVAEFDSEETIDLLERAIRELGHDTVRIGHARALCARLVAGERWDLVFNIAEGLDGRSREAQVPALLELYGIGYTFSDPLVCAVTLDKAVTKRLVRDAGLATPAFHVVRDEDDLRAAALARLRYPLFAKPIAEGTGKGIGEASYAAGPDDLARVCRDLLARLRQPVLVEEYLPGREFTVGLLGNGPRARAIGTMEVRICRPVERAIYSFQNKHEYENVVEYDELAPGPLRERVEALALASYLALECRDGARADIRLDAGGEPSFMEINPLPGLNANHSDLPIIARFAKMAFRDLIGGIIAAACERLEPPHGA